MQRSAVAMLAQQGGGGGGFKVNYSPDWSLFTEGGDLAQLGLNLLAAIGLVCCTGFFVWGAILAAGGVSSDVPGCHRDPHPRPRRSRRRQQDRTQQVLELIVYLALHPQGVTPDELWEALWPDRPVNRGTLHTTVTAARTGLGRAPDGTRYLPDAHDGHYRLSQQAGLDWARFHGLIASGEDDGPDGLEALRSALELVRGVPLTSPTGRGYEWAVVHRTEMETVIAEAAERLALRYLYVGNHRQANWAARRGLLASPYDERLYRVLMRAADAAGNPAGVDAIWKELLTVLDADLDLVDDELHPETIALYAALRPKGRPRPAAPHAPRSSAPQGLTTG